MKSRPSAAATPMFILACALLLMPFMISAAVLETVDHRLQIEGDRGPVVILEGGLGDTLDTWSEVQSAIASQCVRTVSYNRAGYPGSDAAAGGFRDAATIVGELRDELHRQGIAPPYVLVGHSLGGLYMQYFARQYADEVAGLVLVDSTHWNQQLLMGAPNQSQSDVGRRGTVMLFMSFIARRELTDSARAGEQVHRSPHATAVPTVVLSSTGALRGETPVSRTEAARLQEDIVADFPGARHIRVEGSGHYIQKDRPDVVIESVRELAGCPRTHTASSRSGS
jgi:pimeloyl-ACP methyl ester carboxylesterase